MTLFANEMPAGKTTDEIFFAIAAESLAAYYDQAGPRPVRWADLADPQKVPFAFEVRSFQLGNFWELYTCLHGLSGNRRQSERIPSQCVDKYIIRFCFILLGSSGLAVVGGQPLPQIPQRTGLRTPQGFADEIEYAAIELLPQAGGDFTVLPTMAARRRPVISLGYRLQMAPVNPPHTLGAQTGGANQPPPPQGFPRRPSAAQFQRPAPVLGQSPFRHLLLFGRNYPAK